MASSALAQSWKHPELVDYDQATDEHSKFWEQVLAGDEQGYLDLIRHARSLWSASSKQQRALALSELRTAAASKSHKPQAHFWLGQYLFEDRQWEACAAALSTVYAMEPGYEPQEARARNTLDFSLASCLLYSGEYEGAIEHFKRIISLDHTNHRVELRLGEAYMALGRLKEAIEFLELAAAPLRAIEARYALAVALDRAERLNASHSKLATALARDPGMNFLRRSDKTYAPTEDEHYYMGLANSQLDKKTRALYHFRRYLDLAPSSPWRNRAKQHSEALDPIDLAVDLKEVGTAKWEVAALKSALRKIEAPLRACVAGHPLLLVRIDLSAIAGQDRSQLQVRATTVMQAKIDRHEQRRVLDCLETAARRLRPPKLTGSRGSHGSVQFSLLGAP